MACPVMATASDVDGSKLKTASAPTIDASKTPKAPGDEGVAAPKATTPKVKMAQISSASGKNAFNKTAARFGFGE